MIVLDTSALIYWTLDPGKLTPTATQTIENADKIIISAISIWEIGLKAKQKKLDLPLSIHAYVNKVKQLYSVEIQSVTVDIWLENLALEWEHRDPADRTIVTTAILSSCALVSSDRVIGAFYQNTIW